MKQIVAKFYGASVEQMPGTESVRLEAVTADTPENKQWSEFTPCGSVTMAISNPAAQGFIKEGKEYLVTIAEIVPEAAEDPAPARGGNVPNE